MRIFLSKQVGYRAGQAVTTMVGGGGKEASTAWPSASSSFVAHNPEAPAPMMQTVFFVSQEGCHRAL
jgi:hypothetical protein